MLMVVSTLAFGGTLSVSNTGPALVAGDSFKLFSKPGTGTFGTVTLPVLAAGLAWTNKLAVNGSFAVVQAVNLTPTNITTQVSGGNLTLNWPADHTGWRLQAQTNDNDLGLGTNWFDVSNSTATNAFIIPINQNVSGVFYRLIFP
jgi:hypothetical protein